MCDSTTIYIAVLAALLSWRPVEEILDLITEVARHLLSS
jgi:hypothetical protein